VTRSSNPRRHPPLRCRFRAEPRPTTGASSSVCSSTSSLGFSFVRRKFDLVLI
jgi:hypothetical protein